MSGSKERYLEFCQQGYVPLQMQPWWLDAVCGAGRWSAAVASDGGGNITGVLPYWLTRRFGLPVIQLPPFTTYAGPWLRYPDTINPSIKRNSRYKFEHRVFAQLIGQLPRVAFFSQSFRPEVRQWLPFYWAGFRQTTRYTYMLPDTSDLDVLYNGLKNKLRTDLKKAGRATEVVLGNDPELLFRLNAQSFARKGQRPAYRMESFLRLHTALTLRGQSLQWIARDRQTGAPHATLYLVFDERQAAMLISGFDPVLGQRSQALHGLYWEAIRFCSERRLSLDFEGSMEPGIERTIRAFGGQMTPYLQVWKAGNRLLEMAFLLFR